MTGDLVLDALRDARDQIARGWCQGEFYTLKAGDNGPIEEVCMVGALNRALNAWQDVDNDLDIYYAAFRALVHEIDVNYAGCRSLPSWNDAPGRTQDEVLAMYDKAIAHMEESV